METKELRIGNYVKYSNSDILVEEVKGKIHQLTNDDYDLFSYETTDLHEPIPLTEEILAKCGARIVNHIGGYSFYTFSDSKINKCHIDIYDNCTKYYGYNVCRCRFLHQLQNLYFALTGEELNIEL